MQEKSKLISRYEGIRSYEFSYNVLASKVLADCETFALLYALCAGENGLSDPRTIEGMTNPENLEPCSPEDLEPGLAGLVRRNVLSKIGEAYFFNALEYWSIPSLA